MGRYLARKSGFYLVTFVVAVTVDWAIPRFMPGDPIQGLISRMQAQPGSTDKVAWNLTQQLDRTPTDDTEAMADILAQLQERFLDDMPAIPLWYNGLWAQWNTGRWGGWPSDGGNEALPSMWRNYLQMTGMDMITHLQPPTL